MVQGQNFHILNAGKILTEENGTLFTQGVGQDHKKEPKYAKILHQKT
jgi:hypothetical protein